MSTAATTTHLSIPDALELVIHHDGTIDVDLTASHLRHAGHDGLYWAMRHLAVTLITSGALDKVPPSKLVEVAGRAVPGSPIHASADLADAKRDTDSLRAALTAMDAVGLLWEVAFDGQYAKTWRMAVERVSTRTPLQISHITSLSRVREAVKEEPSRVRQAEPIGQPSARGVVEEELVLEWTGWCHKNYLNIFPTFHAYRYDLDRIRFPRHETRLPRGDVPDGWTGEDEAKHRCVATSILFLIGARERAVVPLGYWALIGGISTKRYRLCLQVIDFYRSVCVKCAQRPKSVIPDPYSATNDEAIEWIGLAMYRYGFAVGGGATTGITLRRVA